MKTIILATVLLAVPAVSAGDNKPLPPDAQIKILKTQRQLQQIQLKMVDLQRQYDQAVKDLKDQQTQLVNDCTDAAKAANLDPDKFTCDLNTLTFVPKPENKPVGEKK